MSRYSYARANGIAVVRFVKGQRKVDVMRPPMREAEGEGRSRVVAIAWAQEYAQVASAVTTRTPEGFPSFAFGKAARRVSCVYFYLWDQQMGGAFIKVCAYFPYLKDGRAMRIETVVNDTTDLGVLRRPEHFGELSVRARAINHRIVQAERVGQGTVLASPAFERIAHPSVEDRRRAPALRFDTTCYTSSQARRPL